MTALNWSVVKQAIVSTATAPLRGIDPRVLPAADPYGIDAALAERKAARRVRRAAELLGRTKRHG